LLDALPQGGAYENRSLGCGFFIGADTVASSQHSVRINRLDNLRIFVVETIAAGWCGNDAHQIAASRTRAHGNAMR
jgi:hypothetical protein